MFAVAQVHSILEIIVSVLTTGGRHETLCIAAKTLGRSQNRVNFVTSARCDTNYKTVLVRCFSVSDPCYYLFNSKFLRLGPLLVPLGSISGAYHWQVQYLERNTGRHFFKLSDSKSGSLAVCLEGSERQCPVLIEGTEPS